MRLDFDQKETITVSDITGDSWSVRKNEIAKTLIHFTPFFMDHACEYESDSTEILLEGSFLLNHLPNITEMYFGFGNTIILKPMKCKITICSGLFECLLKPR